MITNTPKNKVFPKKTNQKTPVINTPNTKTKIVIHKKKTVIKTKQHPFRKKKNHITKTPVLIAKKTYTDSKINDDKEIVNSNKNNEKEKLLVDKNAMKKIFNTKDSLQQKERNKVKKKRNKPKKNLITTVDKMNTQKGIKKSQKKWTIASVVAGVNSFSESNSTDFVNTSTNTVNPLTMIPEHKENTISYGINIGYQLHKKWALQTGVLIQKIGFFTNNIYVVNNSTTGEVSYYQINPRGFTNFSTTNTIVHDKTTLKKSFSYIEIPLELKYRLFQTKKFSTQLIAGFSTLFLQKNNVSVTSPTFFNNLGKDDNLNFINFSSNFGIVFDYSLSQKWKINIAPMLKKQINTFSNTPRGFKPYNFGLYSGIQYQF